MAGIIVALLICWFIGALVRSGLAKLCRAVPYEWANVLGEKLATPLGFAVGVLLFYFVLHDMLSLSGPAARGFYTLIIIVVVGVVVWVASRGIDYVIGYLAERRLDDIAEESNDQSRQRLTMLSAGRRVAVFLLLVVGISIVFSRIDGLQQIGYALLSSAGFAAIVLGIAAQSTLGNLVAGIQIAATTPVRIGDAVSYEGNWGNVEDVRFTYLVIRTWDLRRLVVPLKYFIDHPFENWSMTDSKLLKPIYLYCDYRVDVDAIRGKFDTLCRAHRFYNGHADPDFIAYAMEDRQYRLRATVSAENSSDAWTMHCEIREALVSYIVKLEDALPREREQHVG